MTEEEFKELVVFLRRIKAIPVEEDDDFELLLARKMFIELSDVGAMNASDNDKKPVLRELSTSPVSNSMLGHSPQNKNAQQFFIGPRTVVLDGDLFDWLFGDIGEDGDHDDFVAEISGTKITVVKGNSHPDLNKKLPGTLNVAGELFREGKGIYKITNKSGHFRPDDESLLLLALCLAKSVPFGTDLHKAVCSIKLCFQGKSFAYLLTGQTVPKRGNLEVVVSLNYLLKFSRDRLPNPKAIKINSNRRRSSSSESFGYSKQGSDDDDLLFDMEDSGGFIKSKPRFTSNNNNNSSSSGFSMNRRVTPPTNTSSSTTTTTTTTHFGSSSSSSTQQPLKLLQPVWQPDSSQDRCHCCDTKFTMFTRRHHCRNCGYIFCKPCTSKSIATNKLPKMSGHTENTNVGRVCDLCWSKLNGTFY